jgi:hypothetical protein
VPDASFRDALTHAVHRGPVLRLADLLDRLPVALLVQPTDP